MLMQEHPWCFKIFAEKQRRRREWADPSKSPLLRGDLRPNKLRFLFLPSKGEVRRGLSLRSLCASAMQLTGFCEQKLICGLGNNAGSKERTYRHYLTRQILRQSLRVALCEKQEWMVFKNISYHFTHNSGNINELFCNFASGKRIIND